jgi:hypothetical protein
MNEKNKLSRKWTASVRSQSTLYQPIALSYDMSNFLLTSEPGEKQNHLLFSARAH